jgi:hypothetical protein
MPRTIKRTKGHHGGGRATVTYRDSLGQTWDAIITSPGGTATQANLRIPTLRINLANVEKATADHGVNARNKWFL